MNEGHLFLLVFGFALGCGLSQLISEDIEKFKGEAVTRGAAEWVVDPATGDTEFQWKEKQP